MRRVLFLILAAAAAAIPAAGCAANTNDAGNVGNDDDEEVISQTEPLAMPKPILTFLKTNHWGDHHLMWHTVRQWDRLGASDQEWAKKQGWSRADIQEGAKGNGLEFLAMHRTMIRMLTDQYPAYKDLFHGWDPTPPTDCNDKDDPCTEGKPFDANKLKAIDELQNHLADFETDDDLGLYLETSFRPTKSDPSARSADKSAGLHNYLHVRWMDQNSKIDIGDPSVNLQNKRFWRIHGWIEARWTEFRKMKNLSDDDPAYQAAIQKAQAMLQPTKGLPGGGYGSSEPPPDSLRKFFERDPGD